MTDKELAAFLGISETTLTIQKIRHPDFTEEMRRLAVNEQRIKAAFPNGVLAA
jgi:hypothetical protein